MANPLYNMLVNSGMQTQQNSMMSGGPKFANPVQKMQYILQAMQNPAAFVKQHFPDIPNEISNDPNRILQYIQQTRGISNEQINQIAQQIPGKGG